MGSVDVAVTTGLIGSPDDNPELSAGTSAGGTGAAPRGGCRWRARECQLGGVSRERQGRGTKPRW